MPHPYEQVILEAIWPANLPSRVEVWGILDAARDPRIYSAVVGCRQDKSCLYSGDLSWQLQMSAPYLVRLERDDKFTRDLIGKGWGNSWGVFLRSEAGLQTLRRHLRGFLRVRHEAGHWLFFRYYDPRVLRVFLASCSPEEARTFFGPIASFLMEDAIGESIVEFYPHRSEVGRSTVALNPPASQPAVRAWELAASAPPPEPRPLVIRARHLVEYQRSFDGWFVDEALAYLRQNHQAAIEGLADSDLKRKIASGIERATRYGLARQQDLMAYIALQFAVGTAFDALPAIREVLEDHATPPERRMQRLAWDITEQQWDEARRISDTTSANGMTSRT